MSCAIFDRFSWLRHPSGAVTVYVGILSILPALQALSVEPVVPADPLAEAAAHHVLELASLQPCQLFGEKSDALPVAAGHAGDVGTPEEAFRPERIVDSMQPSWMLR